MRKLFIILLSVFSLTTVAQSNVKRVAILETVDKFETVPYMKELMFRSNLTTAISNTPGYEGYDRVDLTQILGEHNFQRTGLVSDNDIKEIGKFTGAQYVLIAEAVIDGEDMFITAKIQDVETAGVINNANELMGTSASEMQEGSKKVAAALLAISGNNKFQNYYTKTIPVGYVDLGLPSGTLWKEENEDCGLITYDEAISLYGSNLPTIEQMEELKDNCIWKWEDNGYKVIGKSGESIFLPAAGNRICGTTKISTVNAFGYYWSSAPYGSKYAFLIFNSEDASVCDGRCYIERCDNHSVRLVK